MPHRDHERRVDEQQDLPDLDHLLGVDVAHGLQHEEQGVSVHLELRALVRLDRVLHRQRVQPELRLDALQLLLARLEEAEPGEGAVAPAEL